MPEAIRTSELLAAWTNRPTPGITLQEYTELGKRANALGECLLAYDIAADGVKKWGHVSALRQIQALALARMGSGNQARDLLSELAMEANPDEETLGLLASTYKDLWLSSNDRGDLEKAYDAYANAYRQFPERSWAGINAATLAFAGGDRQTGSQLADRIRRVCLEELKSDSVDQRYWSISTIAEASLILNDIQEAERRYSEAARIARKSLGNLVSTRRNLGILLRFFSPEVAGQMKQALAMPKIAVFAGHRADTPARVRPRLPYTAAAAVGAAIKEHLIENNVQVGYSSAASGADILFLEALQSIGGGTHIVLPCGEEQFLDESVKPSGCDWETRFGNVLSKADEVVIASKQRLILGSVGYEYANELLHGLASAHACRLDTPLVRMAVWDGQAGNGPGGTADIVSRWRSAGHHVFVITPLADSKTTPAARPRSSSSKPKSRSRRAKLAGFASEIRAMIFADAHRFSGLAEDQMPSFVRNFMGLIADLTKSARPLPLYKNTWGDGLFFVFEKAADAGRFALRLADRVARIDRAGAGLPEDLDFRIALHVGPVYRFRDPITGKPNYIGSHVNQTARIELSAPPGHIYGSQAFVALAGLEAPGEFRFDYVGRIPHAKNFGEFPIYLVQTASPSKLATRPTVNH